jgi:DNA-directed RNA polymerase specialized sigma24 family protein
LLSAGWWTCPPFLPDAAGTSPFAALKKEKFMDGKETCTQRPRSEPDSKALLIARAQQGEEAAFFALYELHKARVYSICLRLAETAQAAERLTRNIFLQVFRKISAIRDDDKFSALLLEAAVRSAFTMRRALAPQPGFRADNVSEAKQGELLCDEASQRHAESSNVCQGKKRIRPRLLELDASPCFRIGNSRPRCWYYPDEGAKG